jgi:Tfp pilus assembly protein PilO
VTADVRVLWFLAAAMFVAGGYWLEARYERAIDASKTDIEALYRNTAQNQRIVAHAAALKAAQATAETELRSVSHEPSLSAVTASLLVTLEDSAHRCKVDVVALQPGTTITEDRLAATDLTVRMRGSFTHLIAFLQDISRHADIISVSRSDLALSSQAESSREPKLDATIHATLYRLLDANAAGEQIFASTR